MPVRGTIPAPTAHTQASTRTPLVLGPAFVAAIAYVDPGNVAANLSAGASFGYLLVWVLVAANLIAMLVQYLSAKLGIVTGHNLPELLGRRLGKRKRILFWGQAEIVAAATDIAEVIGGAVALQILFDVPLVVGGVIVGGVSMLLLATQNRLGQRWFEGTITGLLLIIVLGFTAGMLFSPTDWSQVAGGLVPRFEGSHSVLLAASMLGATVMPHAIYLHSALSRDRFGADLSTARRHHLLRSTRVDVLVALSIAGMVNIAMLLLAAASLPGAQGTDTLEGAHAAITNALGPTIGVVFAVGLLASGLASTSVGAYAGATIMAGLLHIRVPLLLRRAITLIPALLILGLGFDPTGALIISQVVLSLGIPFALVPLLVYTSRKTVMGGFVNPIVVRVVGWVACVLIIALNVVLVVLTVTGVE